MEIKHRTQLVELMKHFKLPLVGVEVGVAEGLNSRDLLDAGLRMLYMVDNWKTIPGQYGDGASEQEWHDKNHKEAMERVAAFPKRYTVLKGMSVPMADYVPNSSVGAVYLDGDHTKPGVRNDLNAYWGKLVPGGIMAGHDYLNSNYGVNEAVKEFAAEHGLQIHDIPEHKDEDSGFWFQKPY